MYMFYARRGTTVLDIPRWSFGKLTSLYYMFAFGGGTVNAADWNLDGVTSLDNAFRQTNGDYTKGSYVYIPGWHSNTVTTIKQMFNYSGAVREIDVSNWDMPALTNAEEVFGYSSQLKRIIGLETWSDDTVDGIVNLVRFCSYCNQLEDVDMSTWNTPNLEQCSMMFAGCGNLKHLDVRGIDTTNVTKY